MNPATGSRGTAANAVQNTPLWTVAPFSLHTGGPILKNPKTSSQIFRDPYFSNMGPKSQDGDPNHGTPRFIFGPSLRFFLSNCRLGRLLSAFPLMPPVDILGESRLPVWRPSPKRLSALWLTLP